MTGKVYDVIVVGGGHAGIEASLAAARMGARTLLLTTHLDTIGWMSCNPSVGGPAKGHLVREIDALGGEMARAIDRNFIQVRMLNSSKGPAVHALRAQADKKRYAWMMRQVLENTPNLDIKQSLVEEVLVQGDRVTGVRTSYDQTYAAQAVVLTTGTFLAGRLITGGWVRDGGRDGEPPALGLSKSLNDLGFRLGRLKTGTPPRLDARTIDFSQTKPQYGSDEPLYFSFENRGIGESENRGIRKSGIRGSGNRDSGNQVSGGLGPVSLIPDSQSPDSLIPRFPDFLRQPPHPVYPFVRHIEWRPQLPCYLIYTNQETHEIILSNLERAPLFTGVIEGVGPRYCPSIEDKIVRFAHKESHQLFLEPEGWSTTEVYLQGANTSLPVDVQMEMVRSIPALRDVEFMRIGYAIEYDYVPPDQINAWLETKRVEGLFHAGQINGTTGYEEAAAQGLMAGMNAVLKLKGRPPLVLGREQAYIGVLIDDLVTQEHQEPYRQMTSRAEYRLLLRQDNADLRLTAIGYETGLVSRDRNEAVEARRRVVQGELARLASITISPNSGNREKLLSLGLEPLDDGVNALQFLRRPEVSYDAIQALVPPPQPLPPAEVEQVEIEAKYEGYIAKQQRQVERMRRLERRPIPVDFDYEALLGLRNEARQKLIHFRPATVGQAARIQGVNPADISLLLVHLEKNTGNRVSGDSGTQGIE
jgi:tRNA uridine 5-carboxymethylaminomethyl modification enzyme